MINVRHFKRGDIKHLHEILESQKFPYETITAQTLPKIGYIAMLGDHPVAVGFLRRVECDVVAQIDGLASNSAFGSVIRHEAISKIVESLINEAKSLKLQGVIAFTSDETVKIRAEATGFTRLSHIVLSLTF